METVYKITKPDLTTYEGFQWRLGEWQTFLGTGDLCGPGWAHFYLSPQLAVLLNPIHSNYRPYRLWVGEGIIGASEHGLKVGCSRARIVREIRVPKIPLENRIRFAIFCALAVYSELSFVEWTENWLNGIDRTAAAAAEAARTAWSAAVKAAAAEAEAARAAWAAAAAAAAAEAATLRVVQTAVLAAAEAAMQAVWAVAGKTATDQSLNLVEIANSALLPWEP